MDVTVLIVTYNSAVSIHDCLNSVAAQKGLRLETILIDNASHEVVSRFSVLTTHADSRGVAKGVVEVFRTVLEQSNVTRFRTDDHRNRRVPAR